MYNLSKQSLIGNSAEVKLVCRLDRGNSQLKMTFADVLTKLSSFNAEITDARGVFCEGVTQPFPDFKSFDQYESFILANSKMLNDESLKDRARFICFLFRLSEAWILPVQIAVLTNVLPLPDETNPIEIITVGDKSDAKTALVFNLVCKREKIVDWVRENYEEIAQSMQKTNTPWDVGLRNKSENLNLAYRHWLAKNAELASEDIKKLEKAVETALDDRGEAYKELSIHLSRLLNATDKVDFLDVIRGNSKT